MNEFVYWLKLYGERFGDTPTLLSLGDEDDAIAAVKEALKLGRPIPENLDDGVDV
jgi:hypothetical protein